MAERTGGILIMKETTPSLMARFNASHAPSEDQPSRSGACVGGLLAVVASGKARTHLCNTCCL